jgi:hypothetical protein
MSERARLLTPGPAWRETLTAVRHDAYHLPSYVVMEADALGGEAVAYCYEDGHQVFLVPLVLRPIPGTSLSDVSSPYGYPGPTSNADLDDEPFWKAATGGLVETLASSSLVSCFVRLHPLLPVNLVALSSVGTVIQHGHTVSIDLTGSEEEMWSQVRPNHRRQINRARRDGAVVLIDRWERLPIFVEMYHETMRRVGATSYYFFDPPYFENLRAALGDQVHLMTVEFGETVAAGGIFFECGGIFQYHLGATRTTYLSRQPTKLMFDEVRRWAKARGGVALHLGGGVGGEGNPLFHFKAGFSRDWRPFHTWRVVADEDVYSSLVLSSAGGGEDAGPHQFFPAYRSPTA